MHFDFGTALVVAALAGSLVLVVHRDDRLFPIIAAVAAGLEALIAFHVISLSSGKFRTDVVLPAVLLIAGLVCWSRTSTKPTITAATVVALVAAIQLVSALGVLH